MDSLRYVGHATTLLRFGETSVLTDPVLRMRVGPLRRQCPPIDRSQLGTPDLVLVSHPHRDHLDLPSLRSLPASVPTVVPRGAAELAARAGRSEIVEMSPGEAVTVGEAEVRAVRAVHDGRRDPWGRRVEALGFVVAHQGRRVYFAGDTDLFAEMADLAPLDVALVPVWGWGPTLGSGHLDPEGAARSLELLRPHLAIPIHWGTLFPVGLSRFRRDRLTQPPLEFERAAGRLTPGVKVRILRPGDGIALDQIRPPRPGARSAVG